MASTQKGLLLLNLGTPEGQYPGPTTEQVREYLREFLMDPYVIDIPGPLRWLLVHGAILPKRPAASAEAYRKVWTPQGSPLLVHHLALTQKVSQLMGTEWRVVAGMRYGNPSIQDALQKLQGVQSITVMPLYPQYSLAATESSVQRVRKLASQDGIPVSFVPAFYDEPALTKAYAAVAQETLQGFDYEHVLFSFHGLPERQVKKTGDHCLEQASCCDRITEGNRDCYRAQSYVTAKGIARHMGLPEGKYTVCFQSRLGRTPWIRPYTDVMYQELAQKGIKRVAVLCPAFVADCLETLEEIAIRGNEDFRKRGGEEVRLVPSLNSRDDWAQAVVEIARKHEAKTA